MSTPGQIDWKTFLKKNAGKMSEEHEGAFVEATNFTSSGKETDNIHPSSST